MDQPDMPRFGQYILLAELGRGTTGTVHMAKHCPSGRLVALKTITPVAGADMRVQVARLHREARILANLAGTLDHKTPDVYHVGEWKGHPYYCREFIDGQTLEQAVKSGSINRQEAMRIIITLARTLAQVHSRGIVHRNLAPDNVLLTPEGSVQLIGFGLVAPIYPDTLSRIAGDVQLVGQMISWLRSQTQGPSSDLLDLIVQRCTLEPSRGGYAEVSLLADDLERCIISPPEQ